MGKMESSLGIRLLLPVKSVISLHPLSFFLFFSFHVSNKAIATPFTGDGSVTQIDHIIEHDIFTERDVVSTSLFNSELRIDWLGICTLCPDSQMPKDR